MAKTITPRQRFETQLTALVENFNRHRAHYLSADYNEAEVRAEFIDRFFDALGWDVDNHAGLGPREREVVREKSETSGRSDYQFRLNDRVVFIVEAKAPHVPLDRTDVIMQAKKYAWNSKETSVAAITDFEEFRLYDATIRPDPKHPEVGLIFTSKYTDYLKPKTLDDLWLLSKESVAAGSIDQLIKMSNVKQRERIPVDQSFLEDLTGWREKLAKAVFKIEPDIDPADLNSVVQVFLDRLIFIRFAEDHGILPKYGLEEVVRLWEHSGKQRSLVNDLNALFHEVNDLLNGEIFRFHRCEKTDWDQDAALVARIIKSLYEGPYRFDVIGVELLGSIYERYLGKTIRVTATRAVVEDKPEVRKAGGVYYTPKYIVDYIVEQTVVKMIDGKTPAQIAKLRILDPACGSGSFLLGAYRELIDYHTRWYAEHRRPHQHGAPGQARLMLDDAVEYEAKMPLEEKAAILKNNIYGVDIDPQAVEITMMSLYIKMLEGERGAIMGRGILPPLRDNIKCGNSLIGLDIVEAGASHDSPPRAEELDRIKPFDWNSPREGFGDILSSGGFDVVIGNPPYIHARNQFDEAFKEYISKHYQSAEYQLNTFGLFIERGLSLLGHNGLLGFIVPNYWLATKFDLALRKLLFTQYATYKIVNVFQVFQNASVDCVLLFSENRPGPSKELQMLSLASDLPTIESRLAALHGQSFSIEREVHVTDLPDDLKVSFQKTLELREQCKLGDFYDVFFGMKPYQVGKGKPKQTRNVVDSKTFNAPRKLDKSYYPLIGARHVQRYRPITVNEWISYGPHLAEPRNLELFQDKRLLLQRILSSSNIHVTYTVDTLICNTDVMTVKANSDQENFWDLRFVQGILGSRLICWFLKSKNVNLNRETFPKFNTNDLSDLPFPLMPNVALNPADKAKHDRMVTLVQRMLDLHEQKQATTSDATRTRLEREINITDEKIDALVYELYGLTKEEIEFVESG